MRRRLSSSLFSPSFGRSFKRTLSALTRSAVHAGSKALVQAWRPPRAAPAKKAAATKKVVTAKEAPALVKARTGMTAGFAGGLHYRLFVPAGNTRGEKLPLLVMLHGCGQDAKALAASTRMNTVASRARFLVLYPEQSRLANMQGCWNWFQTRSGQAQTEADAILAAVDQVCRTQGADPQRVALAGLSAGAGMAALLAARHPERFRAVVMHSGVAPGLAHSTASALSAMRGLQTALPLAPLAAGGHLPPLLVIQGRADGIVAPANGAKAAQLWTAGAHATQSPPSAQQRGERYPFTVTHYCANGRQICSLCEIDTLGHAWSGGAASQAYGDPRGPDASRMVWAFAAKQFAQAPAL